MPNPSGTLRFVSIAFYKAKTDTPKKSMPPPQSPSTIGQSGDETITYSNSASKSQAFAKLYESDDDTIHSKLAHASSHATGGLAANGDLNVKQAAVPKKPKNRSTELDLLGEEILPPNTKRNRSVDSKTSKSKRNRKSVTRG